MTNLRENGMRLKTKYNLNEYNSADISETVIQNKGIYNLSNNSSFILIPDYMPSEKSKDLFKYLDTAKFNYEQLSNRMCYSIGPKYAYSQTVHESNHDWSYELLATKAQTELNTGFPFNSVLINRYKKGGKIPFHSDDEKCLRDSPTIASISFGKTSNMVIKSKDSNKEIEVELKEGSLLIMLGAFNKEFLHSVPKILGLRFNLTFRYVYDDDFNEAATKPDQTHDSTPNNIQDTLLELNSKINDLNKNIAQMSMKQSQSDFNFQKINDRYLEKANTKIVILKAKDYIKEDTTEVTADICVSAINEKMQSDRDHILLSDIDSVSDYRQKNGPVIVNFKNMSVKVRALKNIKNDDNFVVRDCLSKHTLYLRKKALELANKKKFISFGYVEESCIFHIRSGMRAP